MSDKEAAKKKYERLTTVMNELKLLKDIGLELTLDIIMEVNRNARAVQQRESKP